ncbi:MAG: WYL domain-containing protein [Lachnospiraceae bacterium]|nr:WYL domain-containing protein [Lachnospiraceae bacterium]
MAAKAFEVGRKLVGGLESPFKEQLLALFDKEVTQKTYGISPDVYTALIQAVSEGRRIQIFYMRSGEWTERWREVDPRRIYMRQRVLYLYARTVDEEPFAWKSFRLSRIREIRPTGICISPNTLEDDGFQEQQKNAFGAFLGMSAQAVKIRFTGEAVPYVSEGQWHESEPYLKKSLDPHLQE